MEPDVGIFLGWQSLGAEVYPKRRHDHFGKPDKKKRVGACDAVNISISVLLFLCELVNQ